MNQTILIFLFLMVNFRVYGDQPKNQNLPHSELIASMKEGGLILYFRHASTEKDYADQIKADPNDGSTQRVLSEKGWHEAVHIGNSFKYHSIPFGKVYSSQYFRAWQTAWLAFGKYEKNKDFNFLPFEDYTVEQFEEMKKTITPYLSTLPPEGKNTIIVAHDDPFEASTGIYPEPQGVCYVVKPLGEKKFEILGSITPEQW
ncbi:MAG: histidine phosphatase family protein [Verrucomicrobia bacterium TMED40]|mgnify:FL=1|nr:MAG: histidine phosphatase family protein [Verrucomicrobia bacterium TMED40]|tara:strand:+ start:3755 stop:4357 length:603 start_codon:yes stop_codon:yes gene_type:complete